MMHMASGPGPAAPSGSEASSAGVHHHPMSSMPVPPPEPSKAVESSGGSFQAVEPVKQEAASGSVSHLLPSMQALQGISQELMRNPTPMNFAAPSTGAVAHEAGAGSGLLGKRTGS